MAATRDMTRGNIFLHIILYAIPLILGNYLQLTYNMADSIIIGKFLGSGSLAAVSLVNPVMTLMVLGSSGIGMGASIIIARLFGAEEYKRLKREFSTTVIAGTIFSVAVFVIGIIFAREILMLIKTPPEILDEALIYLRIMFVGFLFTFQYNICAHSLRGIGNTFMPVVHRTFPLGLSRRRNRHCSIPGRIGYRMHHLYLCQSRSSPPQKERLRDRSCAPRRDRTSRPCNGPPAGSSARRQDLHPEHDQFMRRYRDRCFQCRLQGG